MALLKNKQTALEWAEAKLSDLNSAVVNGEIAPEEYHEIRVNIWKKAKEIEKDQTIEFANKVLYNAECSFTGRAFLEKDINELYNEKYNKQ